MPSWQLQEAKNRLSELVDRAIADGPQTITRHGKPAAVVVAHDQWVRRGHPNKKSVLEVLMSAPRPGFTAQEVRRLFRRSRARARKISFD